MFVSFAYVFFLSNLFVLEQIYVNRIIVKIQQSSLYPVRSFKIPLLFPPPPPLSPTSLCFCPPAPLGVWQGRVPTVPLGDCNKSPARGGFHLRPATTRAGVQRPKPPTALAPPREAQIPRQRGSSGSRSAREAGPGGGQPSEGRCLGGPGRPRDGDSPRLQAPPPEGRLSKPKHFES